MSSELNNYIREYCIDHCLIYDHIIAILEDCNFNINIANDFFKDRYPSRILGVRNNIGTRLITIYYFANLSFRLSIINGDEFIIYHRDKLINNILND